MTKKAIIVAVVSLVLAVAAPSFAQGPFADVPIDHWAYEAVSQLQDHGIIIGYPDGTFGGKRALTRYEFAMAMSRAIPVICDLCPKGGTTTAPATGGVTEAQVKQWIADAQKPGGTWASPQDVENLKKMTNEFKDELVQIGVDLDALKRDVASLEERVAAIEAEMRRLKITTKLNFFAIMEAADSGEFPVDRDNRPLNPDNNLLQEMSFVRDADVIFNYSNGDTSAKVVLNAGNYLNYLSNSVTSLTGTPRAGLDNADDVSLYMAYGTVPLWGADVTVGRFPIQFTKWTLAKYDVDSYTDNWKTDDGNYYVDGGKAEWTWGGFDILAFAGKNDGNGGLYNYSARPLAGPYASTVPALAMAAGGLRNPAQSAGVRAKFDLGGVALGLNWISVGEGAGALYDQADIWGVDAKLPMGPNWKLWGAYTQTDSDPASGSPALKIDDNNAAWEAGIRGSLGKIGIMAAYKSIEPNFSAPGDWGRIGRYQNPVNIEGPEVGLNFDLGKSLTLAAYGARWEGKENTAIGSTGAAVALPGAANASIDHYKASLLWKVSPKYSFGIEGEWVSWDPVGGGTPAENYYTFTYNRQITDNSRLKLLYQIVDFSGDGVGVPYGAADANGQVAVAQVSMDF